MRATHFDNLFEMFDKQVSKLVNHCIFCKFTRQISSLVTLHLLANVCSDDFLDAPKYKCLVSLDFIKGVSRSV